MAMLRRIPTPAGFLFAADVDAARAPLPPEVKLVINLTILNTPGIQDNLVWVLGSLKICMGGLGVVRFLKS